MFFTLQKQVTSVKSEIVGTEMEFIEKTKGGRKLSKDGFLYIKNKTLTNGRMYWECAQRCSGHGCQNNIGWCGRVCCPNAPAHSRC